MIKKEWILQKALEQFNERGYSEVGVRELARMLEISPGNLSYHFSKKEDILIALLEQFSARNSSFYEHYLTLSPTNAHFLELMEKIFNSQYEYRGVYIGNQYVRTELQSQDRFDYQSIATKRASTFQKIFQGLDAAGQLRVNGEDIAFLVAHITLFGRFWISEATLFTKFPDKNKTIRHYLFLLAKQLSLFATEQGKKSIEEFSRGMS
ncbi:TetR family transcriptional regulator [Cyclobacterium xiamenense]|uniref:TetR/AcrR family transcriptional regulator n=1 Tax=Cyclobacterium xiamenense TaxID=1297121 RepID=UPI0035CEC2AC